MRARARYALVAAHGAQNASTRHRLLQHVERLERRLGPVDVLLPPEPSPMPGRPAARVAWLIAQAVAYARRWARLRRALRDRDGVLVQRGLAPLGPGLIARALPPRPCRIVLDIDDAIDVLPPALQGKGQGTRLLYGPGQSRAIAQRADAIVVSTPEVARGMPGTPVVLPTVPDPSRYAVAALPERSPLLVGWAGNGGNVPYLDPLAGAFRALAADGTATLRVVSAAPWAAGPSEFRLWRLEDEPGLFAELDVGIMPLPDTPYTRAKAGFKLLQYMAAGLPVVASPVGVNVELVERSGAGVLADGPEEWEAALRALAADPSRRRTLGAAGRAFVEELADLEGQADRLAALLRAAA
jgi:glycosyltransferase involved in cell wall biosynthesis